MTGLPESIKALGAYRQFVNYYLTPSKNNPNKMTKVPYNAVTNKNISSTDPSQWMTAEEAFSASDKVGFVFTDSDPYWFLDIDGCLQSDGTWSPLANELISMLPGAAIEVSSSGTGLHLFGFGTLPDHACKNIPLNLELYHTERFVAFGNLDGMTGDIHQDFTPHISSVIDKYFQPRATHTSDTPSSEWTTTGQDGWVGPEDDDELLKIAFNSKSAAAALGNAIRFSELFNAGDDEIDKFFNGDRSSADASLAQHLAFWTGKNCERIKRLMFRSELVREKWNREKYVNDTILNACAMQTSVFISQSLQKRNEAAEVHTDHEGQFIGRRLDYAHIGFLDIKANGKPKGTYGNFVQLLEFTNITCRYNLMSKEVEIVIPGTNFITDNSKNSAIAVLRSLASSVEFPMENLEMYALLHSNENAYHPAINWIDSKPWDGVDRLSTLVSTLDPANPELTTMLVRKWSVGAINHIYLPEGAKSSGVLVLQGDQNLGKTRWLMNLVQNQVGLSKEGVTLNPADRDSVKQTVSYWIVELGELDSTFRRSDIAALKAFITRDMDEFRMPYAKAESKYPRKTALAASVNPNHYLHDPTGSRRFWTVEVGPNMNPDYNIDMQQYWAQIKTIWEQNSEVTWLRPDEKDMLEEHNSAFKEIDVEFEILNNRYDIEAQRTRSLTISEILTEIGVDPRDARKWSNAVQRFTGGKGKRNSRGNIYEMPQLKNPLTAGMRMQG